MRSPAVLTGLTAAALVVAGLAAPAVSAAPEPPPVPPAVSSPLSAVPGTMWQTDNTVSALAYANGVLYVGGSFRKVRPPGAARGAATEVAQAYLAAFRTSDLSLISSWRPTLTGSGADGGAVQALEVSPDGRRLYAGGEFGAVNGVTRSKIAAFDITSPTAPALLGPADFRAAVSGRVIALAATDTEVYVGGAFTQAGGQPRKGVAGFSAATGALLPWKVQLTGAYSGYSPMVTSLEVGRGRVYVGGMFDNVNGVAQHALAVVDPVVGTRTPGFRVPVIQPSSYVTAILVDASGLYVSGRDDATANKARLEGIMALNADTGAVRWGEDLGRCMGDTFAIINFAGSVWAGTHAHTCFQLNGHPEISFPGKAVTRFYASTISHDPATGELRHFFPDTSGAPDVAGSRNNVRAFATDGKRLFVGGGWLTVNGVVQQNLNTYSPRAVVRSTPPVKAAVQAQVVSGRVQVGWTSTTDRDDRNLTYRVYRNAEAAPFATIAKPSAFWRRLPMSVVDTGAVPGSRVSYRLVVTDGDTAVSSTSGTITVPRG